VLSPVRPERLENVRIGKAAWVSLKTVRCCRMLALLGRSPPNYNFGIDINLICQVTIKSIQVSLSEIHRSYMNQVTFTRENRNVKVRDPVTGRIVATEKVLIRIGFGIIPDAKLGSSLVHSGA
jgi:hypothetical protein